MKERIRQAVRKLFRDVTRYRGLTISEWDLIGDLSEEERGIVAAAKPFTMTSVERIAALINGVNHICRCKIPGDFVECGVWRGGSMVVVARTLMLNQDTSRELFLYDTFEGMTPPTEEDKTADNLMASELLKRDAKGTGVWCEADIEDVRQNVLGTGYPKDKVHFIKGKVENTIPATLPGHIALLRLDTDWYESTKHELQHLFPLLDARGILILDDYGAWQGARKAVDEYFGGTQVFLHRIDVTGRMVVGPGPHPSRP